MGVKLVTTIPMLPPPMLIHADNTKPVAAISLPKCYFWIDGIELTIQAKNELKVIWKNFIYASNISASARYWRRIAALLWMLQHNDNSIRLVEGLDNHYWVELDIESDIYILDWNAQQYSRIKNVKWIFPHQYRKYKTKIEPLMVFNRRQIFDNIYNDKAYLIKNRCHERKEVILATVNSEVASLLKMDTGLIEDFAKNCQNLLAEEFNSWYKMRQLDRPLLLK